MLEPELRSIIAPVLGRALGADGISRPDLSRGTIPCCCFGFFRDVPTASRAPTSATVHLPAASAAFCYRCGCGAACAMHTCVWRQGHHVPTVAAVQVPAAALSFFWVSYMVASVFSQASGANITAGLDHSHSLSVARECENFIS